MDDMVGSLEAGKLADIAHFSGSSTRLAYIHDPYQQLVYCAGPGDVMNVWIGGKRVVDTGKLTTVHEAEVVTHARSLAVDLFKRAGLEDVLRRDRQSVLELIPR